MWEYYGKGLLGRLQSWIFRSRIKILLKFFLREQIKIKKVLDVGCGPMFISYSLFHLLHVDEYIGVDILPVKNLKKYRDAMRAILNKNIEAVRASADMLPFKEESFDLTLILDVLEHLEKPKETIEEIKRITRVNGLIAVSLPLENLMQKLLRVGFILMQITGDPIMRKIGHIPISRTPEYHYASYIKSYNEMLALLKEKFKDVKTVKYTPIGFCRAININAVHTLRKS
ncbi:MAG: methyltransferase domain-containing protein [Nitrososphaeria archaeon]